MLLWLPAPLHLASGSADTVSGSSQNRGVVILAAALAIGLAALVLIRGVMFLFEHRLNRRLHVRKNLYWWLRYHDRQYWPLWFFYIPVYCFLPFLALRHRSVWAWLYVNPVLPNGGWWGEKKSELDAILRRCAPYHYLAGRVVRPRDFAAMAVKQQGEFLRRSSFPVVAKPDRGMQGQGVRVAHDSGELRSVLLGAREDLFLQPFDSSPGEAGLLFFRSPESGRIELFSITDKRFPEVVGDGRSSFFELVLADPHARFIAPIYLAQAPIPIESVPAAGHRVGLTRLGNHSKGALFFNDEQLKTSRLEAELTTIFGPVEGLDFGRIDVKYVSREELMAGRFHILELNGAGAESTNIHDPSLSLSEVYGILYRQWDLLFTLGKPATGSFGDSVRRFIRVS